MQRGTRRKPRDGTKEDQEESFEPGDTVLLFNSRFKLVGRGKLRSKWDDPFTVLNSVSHGDVIL
jgi:hypothetical protein